MHSEGWTKFPGSELVLRPKDQARGGGWGGGGGELRPIDLVRSDGNTSFA